ncbi:MAG: DNA mismatch repair protein [Deltaproteobacteria bacterium]|nr:DNA mismatch repair protein [Deltaproteobacteria bacterium]
MATPIPDLLSSAPTRRLDARKTGEALTFAFAQGVADDTWDDLLAAARLPETRFRPEGYARDLFVAELVASCAVVEVDGTTRLLGKRWLERLLSHPPEDAETVTLRRDVLRELDGSPSMRTELEGLYGRLRFLRDQLGITPGRGSDVLRRRLEILATVRGAIDAMAEAFAGARSALTRVSEWAAAVRASEAWRALLELLDYDEHLATVDVRVRVGADGRVRGLVLADVRENAASRFARTPIGRWLARIALVFRGYRFDAEELMARAIEQVFDGMQDVLVASMQLAGDLELYLAAFAFRARAERAGLAVCLPELGATRALTRLFNPLLLPHEKRVVPCELHADRPDRVVLVTGPNSGGKTRLLQAIGLTQLLGQCGFFVPAASATIRSVDGMFVSFGQAPAADATEGRLGTELLRVRALFETICVGGMVLVDELCSGTNPSEGEELFRHVVDLLAQLSPQAFLSTHFLTLAADLERAPPNDRMDFLQVELDAHGVPTYGFVPGVAKTSLAHQTAARLGVTRDDLAALVQRAVNAAKRS